MVQLRNCSKGTVGWRLFISGIRPSAHPSHCFRIMPIEFAASLHDKSISTPTGETLSGTY